MNPIILPPCFLQLSRPDPTDAGRDEQSGEQYAAKGQDYEEGPAKLYFHINQSWILDSNEVKMLSYSRLLPISPVHRGQRLWKG